MNNTLFFYFTCVIGYCLFSAFSRVYANHLLQAQDPIQFCFYIFSIGACFFILLNTPKNRALIAKVKTHWRTVLLLNVTTFGSWFFLIYPLKYLEPALVSIITLSIGPIFSLLLGKNWNKQSTRLDYIAALGLCLTTFYVTQLCMQTTTYSLLIILFSLLCCFIVGFSIVLNGFQTRKLLDQHFSSQDILAIRFFLLVLISFCLSLKHNDIHHILQNLHHHLLLAACVFVIIPLFLIQVSMRGLKPITISLLMPFMPILIYFFEWKIMPASFSAILAALFFTLLGVYSRYAEEKKRYPINSTTT